MVNFIIQVYRQFLAKYFLLVKDTFLNIINFNKADYFNFLKAKVIKFSFIFMSVELNLGQKYILNFAEL